MEALQPTMDWCGGITAQASECPSLGHDPMILCVALMVFAWIVAMNLK